jgi:hypothetical protein
MPTKYGYQPVVGVLIDYENLEIFISLGIEAGK